MAKVTFEEWRAKCASFDENSFHSIKACRKALSKLYSGFQNIKGQGIFSVERHNEIANILDEISKRVSAKKW